MISLIETLNFRCLRYVSQPLGPFSVLVGPNASGKTTFLDVVAFLSDLVSEGLDYAIGERTQDCRDLIWSRAGNEFELAIEAKIPEDRRQLLSGHDYDVVRYEISIGIDPQTKENIIQAEKGWLKVSQANKQQPQRTMFPSPDDPRKSILTWGGEGSGRSLFSKVAGGIDNYYAEAHERKGRWAPFKLGPRKSTLANLPEDEENFPVSSWFKQLLSKGVERIVLNSLLIRKASPPGQPRGFKPDGSNLPWVISGLEEAKSPRLKDWIAHLQTALPDLEDVRTVVRDDDRHRYLVLVYRGGLEVPSWMASDGTLRLLALTLPAYLQDFHGVYAIEEPENGIHPRAVETMIQSLSSVYDAQILMASHSPVILSIVEPKDVLCFAKTAEGATDIVSGDNHPKLARLAKRRKSRRPFRRRGSWMSDAPGVKDLVVLTADGQMASAVQGLLAHGPALGFCELAFDYYVHPQRDPGCFLRGHDFLQPFYRQYRHALVMLDREGCGRPRLLRKTWKRKSKTAWPRPVGTTGRPPSSSIPNWKSGYGAIRQKWIPCWGGRDDDLALAIGCARKAT